MRKTRKILSLVLALVMLAGILPVAASAEEETADYTLVGVTASGSGYVTYNYDDSPKYHPVFRGGVAAVWRDDEPEGRVVSSASAFFTDAAIENVLTSEPINGNEYYFRLNFFSYHVDGENIDFSNVEEDKINVTLGGFQVEYLSHETFDYEYIYGIACYFRATRTEGTKYKITFADDSGAAYTEFPYTTPVTSAEEGFWVYVEPQNIPEGKYVEDWILETENGWSLTYEEFTMPAADVILTPNYALQIPVNIDLRGDDGIEIWNGSWELLELFYPDVTSWSYGDEFTFDIDGDNKDDVKLTFFEQSPMIEKLDGTELTGVYSVKCPAGSRVSSFYFIFSASDDMLIDEIRIDGFESPVVGKKAGECLDLTVPEGCHYRIIEKVWLEISKVTIDDGDTVIDYTRLRDRDKFEDGKEYRCRVVVTTIDGYRFADMVGFYANGSEEMVDEHNIWGYESNYFEQDADLLTKPETAKYAISFNNGGGSGRKADEAVEDGTEYTLPAANTFTAPDGKEFDKWSVKIGDGTAVYKKPGEKITVTANTTVTAVWKDKPATTGNQNENEKPTHDCPAKMFKDVDLKAWYHEYIDAVLLNGLMNGVSTDKFAPNATTTRAMIVTMLYRLAGEPTVSGANPFKDVESGKWYTDAIIWAAENGIVTGYGDGKFGLNDEITREQFAAILYRYAKYKGYDVSKSADLSKYTDASTISSYALDAMKWAVGEGIITGRSSTTLAPKGSATRAEAAAMFMRFIESVK